MAFRFYNSFSDKKEEFRPLRENEALIYSCGPTVYNFAHIGNFRSYIFADLLRRSLKLAGFEVHHAMNLTDVDDKTIKGAKEKFGQERIEIQQLNEYTKPYIKAFFEDMNILGIDSMEYHPRATESIEPMLDLIGRLKEKGFTYQQDGSLYFSINKFAEYGKLSGVDLANVRSGLRYNTDEYTKDDIRDFVLWKNEKEEEGIAWNSMIGRGRPGWHLECSAMIESIFNGPIDIHTGGVDLAFPHHENEIAQSQSAYGHSFVGTWMHCEHLMVDAKKMSKSEGNFYTVRDILNMGYDPYSVRYALLSVHYRQKLNFTLKGLKNAESTLYRIWVFMNRLVHSNNNTSPDNASDLQKSITEAKKNFLNALEDDLNISKALSVFHETIRKVNQFLDQTGEDAGGLKEEMIDAFTYMDGVLNILSGYDRVVDGSFSDLDEEIKKLILERQKARSEKDYARSDELRYEIESKGFKIMDFPEGVKLIHPAK